MLNNKPLAIRPVECKQLGAFNANATHSGCIVPTFMSKPWMCPDILTPAIIDEHTFARALVTLEETRSPGLSCFSSDLLTAYKLARVVDLIQPYAESNSRRRSVGVEVKCMDEMLPVYGLRMADRRRPLCVGTMYSPAFADHVWPVPSTATKARVHSVWMAFVIVVIYLFH